MEDRFLEKVNKTDTCWLWTAGKDHGGYGIFSYKKRGTKAHRVSYMLYKGIIPQGMCVCHTCDIKLCVNPDHLWLGTYDDNNKDKVKKGRQYVPKSEESSRVRLTIEMVNEIREKYATGEYFQHELAKQYSVTKENISLIITGKNWKNTTWTKIKKKEKNKYFILLSENQIEKIVDHYKHPDQILKQPSMHKRIEIFLRMKINVPLNVQSHTELGEILGLDPARINQICTTLFKEIPFILKENEK